MILITENPFRGPLKGLGPKNWDFFGPWNGHHGRSECYLGPKMSWDGVSFLGEHFLDIKEFIYFLIEYFCWKILKFYQFFWVIILKIHFGSGAARIRNGFFLILIRTLPKFSDPTGSGSTLWISTTQPNKRGSESEGLILDYSSPFFFALVCLSSPPNIPGASPYPGVAAPSATQHSLCQVDSRPLCSVFISKINELMSIFFTVWLQVEADCGAKFAGADQEPCHLAYQRAQLTGGQCLPTPYLGTASLNQAFSTVTVSSVIVTP
jgi:hypothetical protein